MNKLLKGILITVAVILAALMIIGVFVGPEKGKSKQRAYQVLGTDHNNAVENFFILIMDTTKSVVEDQAQLALADLCTKVCNIVIYDDKIAYEQEKLMKAEKEALSMRLTNAEITLDQWKSLAKAIDEKYYVFVADHMIGWLDFSEENPSVWFYPYRDARYKELKQASQGIGFMNFIGMSKQDVRDYWSDKISSDFFREGKWNGDGDEFFNIIVSRAGTPNFSATFKNGKCYEHTYKLPSNDVSIVEVRLKKAGYVLDKTTNQWQQNGIKHTWSIKEDVEGDKFLIECRAN